MTCSEGGKKNENGPSFPACGMRTRFFSFRTAPPRVNLRTQVLRIRGLTLLPPVRCVSARLPDASVKWKGGGGGGGAGGRGGGRKERNPRISIFQFPSLLLLQL